MCRSLDIRTPEDGRKPNHNTIPGIPYNAIIDKAQLCIAYGNGDTFSEDGIKRLFKDMQTYTFSMADGEHSVRVVATDLDAAIAYAKGIWVGLIHVYVYPRPVYLGAIELKGDSEAPPISMPVEENDS